MTNKTLYMLFIFKKFFFFNHITLVLPWLLSSSPSPYLNLSLFLFPHLSFSVSPSILEFFSQRNRFHDLWLGAQVSYQLVGVGFFVLFFNWQALKGFFFFFLLIFFFFYIIKKLKKKKKSPKQCRFRLLVSRRQQLTEI